MSFKHSCFIENSKEAREWLEGVGYKSCIPIDEVEESRKYITTLEMLGYYTLNDSLSKYVNSDDVDCIGNLPLFKALTAVRDDSDYLQWFKLTSEDVIELADDEDGFYLCEDNSIEDELAYNMLFLEFHKATKDELIEKFKNKDE